MLLMPSVTYQPVVSSTPWAWRPVLQINVAMEFYFLFSSGEKSHFTATSLVPWPSMLFRNGCHPNTYRFFFIHPRCWSLFFLLKYHQEGTILFYASLRTAYIRISLIRLFFKVFLPKPAAIDRFFFLFFPTICMLCTHFRSLLYDEYLSDERISLTLVFMIIFKLVSPLKQVETVTPIVLTRERQGNFKNTLKFTKCNNASQQTIKLTSIGTRCLNYEIDKLRISKTWSKLIFLSITGTCISVFYENFFRLHL